MQIEKIACNSCGAPLEVTLTTRFVTCRHCRMKLSIQRTATATFTEILDQLMVKTDQLSEQVNHLSPCCIAPKPGSPDRAKFLPTNLLA